MKTDFKEDNKAKLLAHPVVKIFEETMDTIQAGNIDEVFDLNEENSIKNALDGKINGTIVTV